MYGLHGCLYSLYMRVRYLCTYTYVGLCGVRGGLGVTFVAAIDAKERGSNPNHLYRVLQAYPCSASETTPSSTSASLESGSSPKKYVSEGSTEWVKMRRS